MKAFLTDQFNYLDDMKKYMPDITSPTSMEYFDKYIQCEFGNLVKDIKNNKDTPVCIEALRLMLNRRTWLIVVCNVPSI